MAGLKLTLGCGWYDRVEPLKNRTVVPEGIDLKVETVDEPRALFDRLMRDDVFDIAEFSMSEYVALTSRGVSPFVALPVYMSRSFRHSFICINTGAGIRSPRDLEGRRIGVPLHTMSAAIWCRGVLREEYGVDLSGVTWVEGAMDNGGMHGTPKVHELAKPTRIEHNASGFSLTELLERGDIDATLGALMPTSFGASARIARLFPDFRATEIASYKATGAHPIMHLVVIRRSVLDRHPWVAASLTQAFHQAKELALHRLFYTGAPRSMLPMLHAEVEETQAIFGKDPWPDGVASNRPTLDRLLSYMLEDGIITRRPSYDELFPGAD